MTRTLTQLSRPNWNLGILSKPFSPNSLKAIRQALLAGSLGLEPPPSLDSLNKRKNAAILIPFCNVRETPGILLQVRSRSMRSHSGEVSCPGGKVDELLDASLLGTALRETEEELGIGRKRIEFLGSLGPPESSLRGDTVWPFVGFIHAQPFQKSSDDELPLPSIKTQDIEHTLSAEEVEAVFHLPLAELANPVRLHSYLFRNRDPYWAVDVTDLVTDAVGIPFTNQSIEQSPHQSDVDRPDRLEVWGLTGWYLHLLASALSSLNTPKL